MKDSRNQAEVSVDDAFEAIVSYRNGAIGFLEGSRFCPGRKNYEVVEINAENGSIHFNLEKMNFLDVHIREGDRALTTGFHSINVTEADHPYMKNWWPQGHIIGWENTFVHMAYRMCDAIVNGTALSPDVATFEDGYKAAVICDAILEAARTGRSTEVQYDDSVMSPKTV